MFYRDGFLHAIVDNLGPLASLAAKQDDIWKRRKIGDVLPLPSSSVAFINSEVVIDTGVGSDGAGTDGLLIADAHNKANQKLSNRQQNKITRQLRKKQAKEHLKLHTQEQKDTVTNKDKSATTATSSSQNTSSPAIVLRLHHFISTVFRSELNISENKIGCFITNARSVSSHYAILTGNVHVNYKVTKVGNTILSYGDVVSLKLGDGYFSNDGELALVAWEGSEEVARRIEGDRCCSKEGRQGRMMSSVDTQISTAKDGLLGDCDMIKYYREKLRKVWNPEIHETAMLKPLPLTLRVLKPSDRLTNELVDLGFYPVTEEEDFSLSLSCVDSDEMEQLSIDTMQELVCNTWIARDCSIKHDDFNEKKLGIFLSEARLSGEIMQQELSSMIPVSIVASHIKRNTLSTKANLHFLDLCSAPGSKTCQLLTALDIIMSHESQGDFTVVANELNLQRANWMRQRLHQQSCTKALSNLIVTCADGRDFVKMVDNSFDYILCDVPCSSDGTVRKSPKILNKWSPNSAANKKTVQKELLKVGLGLLKPSSDNVGNGGFLVYSTCSLSPLENDQVIKEVIDELNGNAQSGFSFELMDLSKRKKTQSVNGECNSKIGQSNFLRVLPAKSHGGFFVAGIRKLFVVKDDNQMSKDTTIHVENRKNALVTRDAHNTDSSTRISYVISPVTQQCSARLIETMGKHAVISSGVAVMYESNSDASLHNVILQQGCASIVHDHGARHIAGRIKLSNREFIECHAKRSIHHEVLIPIEKIVNGSSSTGSHVGTQLIIELSSSTSEGDENASFLLPATILQVLEEDTKTASVVARIVARPQIFHRALNAHRTSDSIHRTLTKSAIDLVDPLS